MPFECDCSYNFSVEITRRLLPLLDELPGVETDATMKYSLHRPGGDGRAYEDVAYLDDDLLILRSNWGIVHVMIRLVKSQA